MKHSPRSQATTRRRSPYIPSATSRSVVLKPAPGTGQLRGLAPFPAFFLMRARLAFRPRVPRFLWTSGRDTTTGSRGPPTTSAEKKEAGPQTPPRYSVGGTSAASSCLLAFSVLARRRVSEHPAWTNEVSSRRSLSASNSAPQVTYPGSRCHLPGLSTYPRQRTSSV